MISFEEFFESLTEEQKLLVRKEMRRYRVAGYWAGFDAVGNLTRVKDNELNKAYNEGMENGYRQGYDTAMTRMDFAEK